MIPPDQYRTAAAVVAAIVVRCSRRKRKRRRRQVQEVRQPPRRFDGGISRIANVVRDVHHSHYDLLVPRHAILREDHVRRRAAVDVLAGGADGGGGRGRAYHVAIVVEDRDVPRQWGRTRTGGWGWDGHSRRVVDVLLLTLLLLDPPAIYSSSSTTGAPDLGPSPDTSRRRRRRTMATRRDVGEEEGHRDASVVFWYLRTS